MIYVLLSYVSYPFVFVVSKFFARRTEGSILVIQTAKIGDMICTTPVLREIKKAYPGCRLGVAADPVTIPLLKYNPHIDEIIPFERSAMRGFVGKIRVSYALYKSGYSSALILMPNVANLVVAWWAMIPVRVAVFPDFAGDTLKKLLRFATAVEYHSPPRSAQETYLTALRHLGIREWAPDKEVYAEPGADFSVYVEALKARGAPVAGLALGTGNRLKDWGVERFTTLAEMLTDSAGVSIVLLGSAVDGSAGEAIKNAVERDAGPRVTNLCGHLTLTELPALIKELSVVIGVDTGLVYMADALGVPVVDIAGPCDTTDQRPTGPKSRILQKTGLGCVPCSHTFRAPYDCEREDRACVTGISPEEVFEAASELIETEEREENAGE